MSVESILKTCSKCGVRKPIEDFWVDRRRPQGRQSRCKGCRSVEIRSWWRAREYGRVRYWQDPQGERERHLLRKYGVSQVDYDAMFAEQNGNCAVCHKVQTRSFDVDHNHHTGIVRGLLCTSCNRMIGHAGDSVERLEAAAAYLRSRRSLQRSSVPISMPVSISDL